MSPIEFRTGHNFRHYIERYRVEYFEGVQNIWISAEQKKLNMLITIQKLFWNFTSSTCCMKKRQF